MGGIIGTGRLSFERSYRHAYLCGLLYHVEYLIFELRKECLVRRDECNAPASKGNTLISSNSYGTTQGYLLPDEHQQSECVVRIKNPKPPVGPKSKAKRNQLPCEAKPA